MSTQPAPLDARRDGVALAGEASAGDGEPILLLHGNCESGEAWYAWVPQLARRYRVVRPDVRG